MIDTHSQFIKMLVPHTWIALLLIAAITTVTADTIGECRLDDGQCVYKVQLVPRNCATVAGNSNGVFGGESHPIQSDSNNKIIDIENTLQRVKLEHSKMIHELQTKIDKLSTGMDLNGGQSKTNTINAVPRQQDLNLHKIESLGKPNDRKVSSGVLTDPENLGEEFRTNVVAELKGFDIPVDLNRTENSLLQGLHNKFTKLRLELLEARRRLRDTEDQLRLSRSQLNKTEETLRIANEALKKSEEQLLETETKKTEMAKLLVKKTKETDMVRNKLKHCRKQIKTKDIQIWKLDSDLSQLRKELEDCREELRMSKLLLQRALIKYHDLNIRHDNTSQELIKTRQLLDEHKARGRVTSFCGFEDPELCGYTKDNETGLLQWIQWSMATPSHWTGPEGDHTCGNGQGHYLYVEATAMASDRRARLISPRHSGDDEQCVEFYYHMYGRNIGTLNVILIVHNRTESEYPPPAWRAYGNQGNVWTMAHLLVPKAVVIKGYQVVFEVFTAAGYAGDIAIDDVRVFEGKCYGSESLNQWRTKQRNHQIDLLREG